MAQALIVAGGLAGAADVCGAGLARSRDAGDVFKRWGLLPHMVFPDLHAGRIGGAAARHRADLTRLALSAGLV